MSTEQVKPPRAASTILLLRGIDSTQEFVERHKQAMGSNGDGEGEDSVN